MYHPSHPVILMLHSLITWLIVLLPFSHHLHLLFSCVLSIVSVLFFFKSSELKTVSPGISLEYIKLFHWFVVFLYLSNLQNLVQHKHSTRTDSVCIYRMIFHYVKTDWHSFRSYMMEAPLPTAFKYAVAKTAALVTDWILSSMESFIPTK